MVLPGVLLVAIDTLMLVVAHLLALTVEHLGLHPDLHLKLRLSLHMFKGTSRAPLVISSTKCVNTAARLRVMSPGSCAIFIQSSVVLEEEELVNPSDCSTLGSALLLLLNGGAGESERL